MKLAKVRALALVCRPAGKSAHASTNGNDQSARTALTVLSLNSGANIHSDAMATPRSASTHFRTPTVVFRRTRPLGRSRHRHRAACGSTRLGMVPVLGDRNLAKAVASILGDEAMHWAI